MDLGLCFHSFSGLFHGFDLKGRKGKDDGRILICQMLYICIWGIFFIFFCSKMECNTNSRFRKVRVNFLRIVFTCCYRILFQTIVVCGCLLYWHWKASLISHLSVVTPFIPFSSLEELLYSSYQITTLGSSAEQTDFEGANSGFYKDLWREKFLDTTRSLTETYSDGAKIALDSSYTLYVDIDMFRSLEDHNYSRLKITNVLRRKAFLRFAFPKSRLSSCCSIPSFSQCSKVEK